jgi:hypothetical protein
MPQARVAPTDLGMQASTAATDAMLGGSLGLTACTREGP